MKGKNAEACRLSHPSCCSVRCPQVVAIDLNRPGAVRVNRRYLYQRSVAAAGKMHVLRKIL